MDDILPDIGFCSNGNFPLYNPLTSSIDCSINDLQEALNARTSCQVEADNNPEDVLDSIESAEQCDWEDDEEDEDEEEEPDGGSCSLPFREKRALQQETGFGNISRALNYTEVELDPQFHLQNRATSAINTREITHTSTDWPRKCISQSVFPYPSSTRGSNGRNTRICDATYFCPGDDSHFPNSKFAMI